jgi:hypothetical protein
MATDTTTGPAIGPTIPVEHMPEKMKARAPEINTYMRAAPQLLREGNDGKYVLINGDQLFGIWDTFGDALQAGYDRFGLDGPFMAQRISSREYEHFLNLVDKPYGAIA